MSTNRIPKTLMPSSLLSFVKNNTYFIRYLTREEKERLVVLPSWRKLLGWFLRESRNCIIIYIWIAKED